MCMFFKKENHEPILLTAIRYYVPLVVLLTYIIKHMKKKKHFQAIFLFIQPLSTKSH